MMMPKLIDVIEFVKDGQSDPEMEKTLSLHRDGQELLKQARFICKMLENEADDKAAVGDELASFDMNADGLVEIAEMRLGEPSRIADESGSFSESLALMEPPEYSNSIGRIIEQFGRRGEDLGALAFEGEKERIVFSYEPSELAKTRYGERFKAMYMKGRADVKGLQIVSKMINVSVPESMAQGERMIIRVTVGPRQRPAGHIEFLFMPESGPFVQLRADAAGMLELPGPDHPGTLRIAAPTPQILHIKPKKRE